jgi:hypothetical protein
MWDCQVKRYTLQALDDMFAAGPRTLLEETPCRSLETDT